MTTGLGQIDIQGALATARAAQAPGLPTAGAGASAAEIQEAAMAFEARFITEMLKPVFDTLPTDGPFGGGHGEETMRGLLVEEMGKSIANGGGFGLADAVARQLLATQEERLNP